MAVSLIVIEFSKLVGDEELSPSVGARIAFVFQRFFVVNHIDVSINLLIDAQDYRNGSKNQGHHKYCVGNTVESF